MPTEVRNICVFLFFLLLLATSSFACTDPDSLIRHKAGKILFQTNCSPCHSIHREVVGPQLGSITKKRSEAWLIAFIRDSQKIIVEGDAYADHVYRQYHQQVMPSFKALSESEIKDVLYYIKTESSDDDQEIAFDLDIIQNSRPDILAGRALFQNQCSTCHAVYNEDYGPALGSVTKRLPRTWIIPFVKNSQKVIKSGDPYASHLYAAFDHHIMVTMDFLTDQQINSILNYIEYASSSEQAKAGVNSRKISNNNTFTDSHEVNLTAIKEKPHSFKVLLLVLVSLAIVVQVYIVVKLFRYLNVPDFLQ